MINQFLLTILDINNLIGWPIWLPVSFTIGAFVIFIRYFFKWAIANDENNFRRLLYLTTSIIFLVWTIGWGLYMVAISSNNSVQSGTLEIIFRSATTAISLFAFNIDSNIIDAVKSVEIKGLLSLMSFIAGLCTLSLLTLMIFHRFWASLKLWFHTRFNKILGPCTNIYLFWGNNVQSQLLAKSIREEYLKKKSNDYKIIIAEPGLSDKSSERYSIRHNLINLFTHHTSSLSEADKPNTLLSVTSVDIGFLSVDSMEDIFEKANLGSLKRLLINANNHLFFLSDDENYNIACIRNLSKDTTINSIKEKCIIHCRARRNDLYGTIEDLAIAKDLEVRIMDPSNLSIELLKRDVSNHPITLMDLDKDNPATVNSPFYGLVVGFDATGRDAFRFMYEFGAFIDSSSTAEDVRRSPFHCKIVDKQVDLQAAPLTIGSPALMTTKNFDEETPLVEFVKCDYNHSNFFDQILLPWVDKINMIFITVGHDDEGIALAVRIFKYIRRHRTNGLNNLRIYVRCDASCNEGLMQQIAAHYNEGCQAAHPIIIPFGREQELYTYELIINEMFLEEGKKYQKNYAQLSGDILWDQRRALATGRKKYRKDANGDTIKDGNGNPILDEIPLSKRKIELNALASLRRKEHQDMANALHAQTKRYLLKKSFSKDFDWDDFFSRYFDEKEKPKRKGHSSGSQITYDLSDYENQIIRSLAMLEHLRWNASHELLGYVRAEKGRHACDEQTMQHNCLRSWQELDKESFETSQENGWETDYISYDFSVIDTMIAMLKNSY